jgi:SAM-dependent methyltransferase
MPIRCPTCHQTIDLETGQCNQGHSLSPQHGVLRLMTADFYDSFGPYLKKFEAAREMEGLRIKNESIYEKLPFVDNLFGRHESEWMLFRSDWQVSSKMTGQQSSLKVLNYGAWNGWLSNLLVNQGHQVTAIGYFIDPYDGLGAVQFYRNDWLSIQMDIEDLSIIDEQYDFIILNRGISFCRDPLATVRQLIAKLKPEGRLLITGLDLYRKSTARRAQLEEFARHYRQKYSLDLFFRPAKGFIDRKDKRALETLGVRFHFYPQLWKAHLKALVNRSRPWNYYGLFHNRLVR